MDATRERGNSGRPAPHQPPAGGSFSLRAKSRLRRLRSDTRLRAQPLGGEGIFYWFSPAATTAASAMELTFVWKESLRLVRMAGTLVPVRMQPFLQSAVWTSVL